MRIANIFGSTLSTCLLKESAEMVPPVKRAVLPPGEIPYVSPDGGITRYYADRYYLDAPTALAEYQQSDHNTRSENCNEVDGSRGRHRRSKHTHVDYCNKCGEKMCDHDDADGSPNNSHCYWPPLFDRAKFINSLDLTAAIIATFSIGDLEYLTEEFPRLFPSHRCRKNPGNFQYVPTLVLHGQRGFNLEKWSRSRGKSRFGTAEEGIMTALASRIEMNEPIELRGGGGGSECSSSSSPSSHRTTTHATTFPEQFNIHHGEMRIKKSPSPPPSSSTKRTCFTYGSQVLNLPQTPLKRRRTSRKKLPPNESTNMSCMNSVTTDKHRNSPKISDTSTNYRNSIAHETTGRNNSNRDVIEIDSNSDSDDDNNECGVATQKLDANLLNSLPHGVSLLKNRFSFPIDVAGDITSLGVNGMSPLQDDTYYMHSTLNANNGGSDECLEECGSSIVDITPNKLRLDHDKQKVIEQRDNHPTVGWGGVKPASVFGGEVFFTQVLPRWRPPPSSNRERKRKSSSTGVVFKKEEANSRPTNEPMAAAQYTDDIKESISTMPDEKADQDQEITTTAGGVHHPKYFLLFETSGSLIVIVSTSNLTPQQSLEGSWVQRFQPKEISPLLNNSIRNGGLGTAPDGGETGGGGSARNAAGFIDYGMPSDFGAILVDFLLKQSDAAASGGMLPDVFLRRYVPGLSSGLNALTEKYRFADAHVHLVSTVPGDYVSGIPKNAHRDPTASAYKPRISYGPQRVSYVLSRILNSPHIRSARIARAAVNGRIGGCRMEADTSWFPPSLVGANDRLVIQPTALGGNWTREDLEVVVQSYLRPHWESPRDTSENSGTPIDGENSPLNVLDIVWPSMECIAALKQRRSSIMEKIHPELAANSTTKLAAVAEENSDGERREVPLFLSSISFAKLDRSCISRMSLFTHVPNGRRCTSTSIHFKSICRLLRLANSEKSDKRVMIGSNQQPSEDVTSKEYLSWFMLTSACLSRGAQGRPTPHSDPAADSMSYMNFELGILFCSRLMGDNVHDRIYVADPEYTTGCQCGKGGRWYKSRFLRNGSVCEGGKTNGFLDSVRKVHLPVPYRLRPIPYRTDPDSDLMDYTPFMHDIPGGTECVGNMKLTPFGRRKMELKTIF